MRHLFLSTALLLTAAVAHAQLAPGTKLAGGSIGYVSNHNEADNGETTDQQFNFSPRAGYFLTSRWAVGLGLSITAGRASGTTAASPGIPEQTLTSRNNGWQVGPFARYYTMFGSGFGLFGQLSAAYSYNVARATGEYANALNTKTTQRGGIAELLPGLVFFPHPKLGLEATAGSLAFAKVSNRATVNVPNSSVGKSSTTSFRANAGLEYLRLGASYYFGQRP